MPLARDKAAGLPLFLAPMAGVTNTVFRRICRRHGADILTSEFVSAEGILHRNARTREYLEFHEDERPFGVQLFGAEPERLAAAAAAVVDWVHPDFVDLNFGCPVNKVVSRHGGSALLRDCPLLEKVAHAVVAAVHPLPVSAKIRIGWDATSINATTTARILEQAGVARIAVHGRTKEQGYGGAADWTVIAEVARTVRIPVVGNGDIASATDAVRRAVDSGVRGLMVGRAAMNRPWIFQQIRAALGGLPIPPDPSPQAQWQEILDHCEAEAKWRGCEQRAMRSMRSRLMAYTRGMPGGRELRREVSSASTLADVRRIADSALADLESHGSTA